MYVYNLSVGTAVAIIGMLVVGWYGKKEFNRLQAALDENGKDQQEMDAVDNDTDQLNAAQEQLNLEQTQSE